MDHFPEDFVAEVGLDFVLDAVADGGQFGGLALGAVGGLLEFDDELADFEHCFGLRIGRAAGPLGEEGGEAEGHLGDHVVGEFEGDLVVGDAVEEVVEFLDLFGDVGGGVEELAVDEPFLEAALAPGAEVLV